MALSSLQSRSKIESLSCAKDELKKKLEATERLLLQVTTPPPSSFYLGDSWHQREGELVVLRERFGSQEKVSKTKFEELKAEYEVGPLPFAAPDSPSRLAGKQGRAHETEAGCAEQGHLTMKISQPSLWCIEIPRREHQRGKTSATSAADSISSASRETFALRH